MHALSSDYDIPWPRISYSCPRMYFFLESKSPTRRHLEPFFVFPPGIGHLWSGGFLSFVPPSFSSPPPQAASRSLFFVHRSGILSVFCHPSSAFIFHPIPVRHGLLARFRDFMILDPRTIDPPSSCFHFILFSHDPPSTLIACRTSCLFAFGPHPIPFYILSTIHRPPRLTIFIFGFQIREAAGCGHSFSLYLFCGRYLFSTSSLLPTT
jgi:hypothetical protein